jgi:hypothetical protein
MDQNKQHFAKLFEVGDHQVLVYTHPGNPNIKYDLIQMIKVNGTVVSMGTQYTSKTKAEATLQEYDQAEAEKFVKHITKILKK